MSTIKSSSEDLTLDADGGSSEIKLKINNVEKASISSAGAFTSTTIDATKLTGEKRNYIIDGDFTQWPEGTGATALAHGSYTHALWEGDFSMSDGTFTWERSTDVPTVAASSHQSAYSLLIKCTGAATAPAGVERVSIGYHVTGNDFAHLHKQQVTFSWWAKTASANSGDTYTIWLKNSANDRTYLHDFTPTSTWTQFTHTLTMDTSGTWLFTEADEGLMFAFTLAAGPDRDGTNETWEGANDYSTTSTSDFTDSSSNEFYLSQVGLYLGSTAPTFSSPPIATVKDQVAYYIEELVTGPIANAIQWTGQAFGNTTMNAGMMFKEKRRVPDITLSAASTFHYTQANGTKVALTGNDTVAAQWLEKNSFNLDFGSITVAQGDAVAGGPATTACSILVNARH